MNTLNQKQIYVYSFYRFKTLKSIKSIKKNLNKFAKKKFIYGTILIANEGVNGTLSGSKTDLENIIYYLKKIIKIRKLSVKISKNQFVPFYRLKIRIKKEIVTIGDTSINPEKITGQYVTPLEWDRIIKNNEYLVIDTRNDYEIDIGSFKNSINLKTKSFREFPLSIEKMNIQKDKPIAMFCTGGIRCEKASSYLIENGYKNVFQLEGGILNYLEYHYNKKKINWNGECFVFDNRVAVNKKLKQGSYEQCYGCRHPITKSDMKLDSYVKGVSCRYCINRKNKKKLLASYERQKQIDYAETKDEKHSFKKIYGRN